MTDQIVSLREYVEALLRENQRAMQLAETEREKAAAAIRQATGVAEQEREKAAAAVRQATDRAIEKMGDALGAAVDTLEDRMDAGDERLREHINFQYAQIAQALDSARREAAFAQAASTTAIGKAEAANERRFEAANEWRGQSADRERTQAEALNVLTSTFLPREVADALFADLRRKLETHDTQLSENVGRDTAITKRDDQATGWKIAAASGAVSVVVVASQLAFG